MKLNIFVFLFFYLPAIKTQTFWMDLETANLTAKPTASILGKNGSILGPLYLDERAKLACVIKSNDSVDEISATWTLSSVEIASHSVSSRKKILTSLSLLPKRNHHFQKVCCIALWRDSFNVATDCASIEIIAPPQKVQIVLSTPLLEGVPSEIHCLVHGSRPPPVIWWSLDRKSMPEYLYREDEPTSLSVLVITPEISQKGLRLECRASNPQIPHKQASDYIQLEIQKGPEVELSLGRGLNETRIKKGSDIFFECRLIADLPDWIPKRDVNVTWFKDENRIRGHSSTSEGYLVLRNVSHRDEGNYSCIAESQVYRRTLLARSNRLAIKIQYPPKCRFGRSVKSIFVDDFERQVTIVCDVDAEADLFKWKIGSRVFFEKQSNLLIEDVRDLLHHPVQCWASNWVGFQHSPCVFYLLPRPERFVDSEASKTCRVLKTTQNKIEIECEQIIGYITVRQIQSGQTIYSRYIDENVVQIEHLQPSTVHLVDVGGLVFQVVTSEMPALEDEEEVDRPAWVLGACLMVLGSTVIVILFRRKRSFGSVRWNKYQTRRRELSLTFARHWFDGSEDCSSVERRV